MTMGGATGWLRHPSRGALVLALAATGTALCLSTLSGWQRGGWLVERVAWVAIGVVLVLSAHLLPALGQLTRPAVRWVGGLLWVACMVAAGYGHATFFLWSQQHAGEARAAAVVSVEPTGATTGKPWVVTAPGRPLSVIAAERAKVVAALASANAKRCRDDCAALRGKQAGLGATLDALDVEAEESRRQQSAEDRQQAAKSWETVRRDAARHDPVMTSLAASIGVTPASVEFLGSLILAAALEGVACYGWFLVLATSIPPRTEPVTNSHTASVATVSPPVGPVTASHGTAAAPASPTTFPRRSNLDAELTLLHRDIAAGQLRPTVVEIRRHLGCSQAKASALRRQLVA